MSEQNQFKAMISATARDLEEQRLAAQDACIAQEIFPVWMKHLPARDANGLQVSMEMVDQADVYIGIYAWRYGWVPEFDNPKQISITEMEFDRALARKASGELKAILIFIMDESVPVLPANMEMSDGAQRKLKEFKQRASTERIVVQFKSGDDLRGKIIHALTDFRNRLPKCEKPRDTSKNAQPTIPKPPAFYAEPDYIGSHKFIGREAELQVLTDWAKPADPTNLLLFEAIGGNGKSILTWEWTKNHALAARPADSPWAGRFWYSFYERGAIMADFCQRALAYMTSRPLEDFAKKKTAELKDELLAQLHTRPWLLILDGLERVLVAYHRIDAAEVPDEEANAPTDKIVNRNPCDAIRDEDNDLLRALAAAAPSKLLVSSRLTPRVLLNPSGQAITGAKRITLPGLRPPDAEALLRSCGKREDTDTDIEGTSAAIQSYLTANCDNHPLVIGILGGLINKPGRSRGHFDKWVADPKGGAALDLGKLDLIQRRNHILEVAIEALSSKSRDLLSTLALVSESVDCDLMEAFNPHIPPEPTFVKDPQEGRRPWAPGEWEAHQKAYRALSPEKKKERDATRERANKEHKKAVRHREEYLEALAKWKVIASSPEVLAKLWETVDDLESQGLLQFDRRTKRYDLHPVVRSVASGVQQEKEKQKHGRRVADHFSAMAHCPYEEAETMEDVHSGLHVVRTLLKLGHFQQAADAYRGDLANSLLANLGASAETSFLLRPFFPSGWGKLPTNVDASTRRYLAGNAAVALGYCEELSASLVVLTAALRAELAGNGPTEIERLLDVISWNLTLQNQRARALRVGALAREIATLSEHDEYIFISRLRLFTAQSQLGQWAEAGVTWRLLDPMGRKWQRAVYRPGWAEGAYAEFHFGQGTLQESHLAEAEHMAAEGKDRTIIRDLHGLRGKWRLERREWALAAASYQEAVQLARERSLTDARSETGLAVAKHYVSQLPSPRDEAERLAQLRNPSHRYLAMLWYAIGDTEQAKKHALAAYKWAWADGEPYVNRYELTKTTELLQQLNVPIPKLPLYDSTKDEPLPWETDVRAAIETLRAEKEAKKQKAE